MSFRYRINLAASVSLSLSMILGGGVAGAKTAAITVPFKICAEPDNFPMSKESSRSGFEIEAAELLAKEIGRPLEIEWVQQRDQSFFRMTIDAGVCDAIMGVPSAFHRLTTTRPWYRTGFAFVARPEMKIPSSLSDPEMSKLTIGVPATGDGDTPAGLALTRHGLEKNLRLYSIFDPARMISAVANKEIDAAVVWGPFAGWYAGEQKTQLSVGPLLDPGSPAGMDFDISIGLRKGNEELKRKLDRAIFRQHAALANILAKWRVPVRSR